MDYVIRMVNILELFSSAVKFSFRRYISFVPCTISEWRIEPRLINAKNKYGEKKRQIVCISVVALNSCLQFSCICINTYHSYKYCNLIVN